MASPANPLSAACACATAWPVPSCSSCRTIAASISDAFNAAATSSPPWPTTTTTRSGPTLAPARSACSSSGAWPTSCRTLGISDCMRLPCPAARTINDVGIFGLPIARLPFYPRGVLPQPGIDRRVACMKRCVIFDLDGTLADTSGDLIAAANAAFLHLRRDTALDPASAEDRAAALKGGRSMLRRGLAKLGAVDDDEVDRGYQPLLDAYDRDIARHTTFYPGALDAVRRLRARGDAVGICTNKPEALAEKLMAALGARDLFDSLVGADTLAVRKPHPEHLTESVARAGGDMARTVLIGDTDTDRKTARAAGVPCILVTFAPAGRSVAELSPEALLDDYDELERVLAGLGL